MVFKKLNRPLDYLSDISGTIFNTQCKKRDRVVSFDKRSCYSRKVIFRIILLWLSICWGFSNSGCAVIWTLFLVFELYRIMEINHETILHAVIESLWLELEGV